MNKSIILFKLSKDTLDTKKIIDEVIQKPTLISGLIYGLSSEDKRVKYRSAKVLKMLSEEYPKMLKEHIDFFIKLLETENTIIKWNTILILGNLAKVDAENKINKILVTFYRLLNAGVMITANNTIISLGKIAEAKQELRGNITLELLNIEKYQYDTKECNNIAVGQVIMAISSYFPLLTIYKEEVIQFVKRQLGNTRNATRKKAENFLKKYSTI
jgi:hypothetical protein